MTYTMGELASLDVDALHQKDDVVCKVCHEPIHESPSDSSDEPMCDYCALGELIEQHPIGLPFKG
jgi:formylmethanofuran dehydrogenase subunit E